MGDAGVSLTASYLRALRPKKPGGAWVSAEAERSSVAPDAERLRRFRELCGFAADGSLPLIYPHLTAFTMSMALITRRDFPIPVLGVVHIRNEIEQVRLLEEGEPLSYRVWIEKPDEHPKGTAFDARAEVRDVTGEEVWRSTSTYLHKNNRPKGRGNRGEADSAKPTDAAATTSTAEGTGVPTRASVDAGTDGTRVSVDAGTGASRTNVHMGTDVHAGPGGDAGTGVTRVNVHMGTGVSARTGVHAGTGDASRTELRCTTWDLTADLGRRYASISGDRNPIHLYAFTAKPFGFPRQIAHGMYTLARCLASSALPPSEPFLSSRLTAEFRAPVLLPSTVEFTASADGFSVVSAHTGRVHLIGEINPL